MYKINYTHTILDDVHGHIPITDIEYDIIKLPIFKRLQDIKQLSLTNWIFPGSEHTRYSHSLGVMHIIDKIAFQFNDKFDDLNRQIIRLAGLLHDIGHYPLSHVGETAYKKTYSINQKSVKKFINIERFDVKDKLDTLILKPSKLPGDSPYPYHHENISATIVKKSKIIRKIFRNYFDINQLNNIFYQIELMITGVYPEKDTDNIMLKIQLLHSELDADRLDYILRDSKSSGTNYGQIDINYLISNLCVGKYNDNDIMCVKRKAISSADQFLINRFFSYNTVIYNDKVSLLGKFAEILIGYYSSSGIDIMLSREALENIILDKGKQYIENSSQYYKFNDHSFWNAIYNKTNDCPNFVQKMRNIIFDKETKKCVDSTEIKLITSNVEHFLKQVKENDFFNNSLKNGTLPVFIMNQFTEHLPYKIFIKNELDSYDALKEDDLEQIKLETLNRKKLLRMMDGIAVKTESNDVHLLIDDELSFVHNIYDLKFLCLREYEIN